MHASVIGPASRSHIVGEKTVRIEKANIISAGVNSHDYCEDDERLLQSLAIVSHTLEYKHPGEGGGGGHVRIIIPAFVSEYIQRNFGQVVIPIPQLVA